MPTGSPGHQEKLPVAHGISPPLCSTHYSKLFLNDYKGEFLLVCFFKGMIINKKNSCGLTLLFESSPCLYSWINSLLLEMGTILVPSQGTKLNMLSSTKEITILARLGLLAAGLLGVEEGRVFWGWGTRQKANYCSQAVCTASNEKPVRITEYEDQEGPCLHSLVLQMRKLRYVMGRDLARVTE